MLDPSLAGATQNLPEEEEMSGMSKVTGKGNRLPGRGNSICEGQEVRLAHGKSGMNSVLEFRESGAIEEGSRGWACRSGAGAIGSQGSRGGPG